MSRALWQEEGLVDVTDTQELISSDERSMEISYEDFLLDSDMEK